MRNVSLNLGSGEAGGGCHARPLCRRTASAEAEATARKEVMGRLRRAFSAALGAAAGASPRTPAREGEKG